jgi:hypothetical protein
MFNEGLSVKENKPQGKESQIYCFVFKNPF